tara:strand:+ start:1258 stop:1971 length:714 start_codon:yes stop_codon:yes gene_type:complete
MTISKFIVFSLNYRDGGNFKDNLTIAIENDLPLTDEQINTWWSEHGAKEDVIAAQYGLPNIARFDHEHEECPNGIDHCYMTVELINLCNDPKDIADYIVASKDYEKFSVIYNAMINKGLESYAKEVNKLVVENANSHLEDAVVVLGDAELTTEQRNKIMHQCSDLMKSIGYDVAMCPTKSDSQAVLIPKELDMHFIMRVMYGALDTSTHLVDLVVRSGRTRAFINEQKTIISKFLKL